MRSGVGVRPAVALHRPAVETVIDSIYLSRSPRPDTLRHRPDTERTCLAVEPTQFTPPHQTRQNIPAVFVVSGVAV